MWWYLSNVNTCYSEDVDWERWDPESRNGDMWEEPDWAEDTERLISDIFFAGWRDLLIPSGSGPFSQTSTHQGINSAFP